MTYVLMITLVILETLNLNWLFFKAQRVTYPRDAKAISAAMSAMLIYLYTIVITGGKL